MLSTVKRSKYNKKYIRLERQNRNIKKYEQNTNYSLQCFNETITLNFTFVSTNFDIFIINPHSDMEFESQVRSMYICYLICVLKINYSLNLQRHYCINPQKNSEDLSRPTNITSKQYNYLISLIFISLKTLILLHLL